MVIFSQPDLDYAFELYSKLTPRNGAPRYDAFYFTSGTDAPAMHGQHTGAIRALNALGGYQSLADYLIKSRPEEYTHVEFNEKTFVGCQQHVLLWPQETTGV